MLKELNTEQIARVAGGYYSPEMIMPQNWALIIRADITEPFLSINKPPPVP